MSKYRIAKLLIKKFLTPQERMRKCNDTDIFNVAKKLNAIFKEYFDFMLTVGQIHMAFSENGFTSIQAKMAYGNSSYINISPPELHSLYLSTRRLSKNIGRKKIIEIQEAKSKIEDFKKIDCQ